VSKYKKNFLVTGKHLIVYSKKESLLRRRVEPPCSEEREKNKIIFEDIKGIFPASFKLALSAVQKWKVRPWKLQKKISLRSRSCKGNTGMLLFKKYLKGSGGKIFYLQICL
jgi:hypothetical protein